MSYGRARTEIQVCRVTDAICCLFVASPLYIRLAAARSIRPLWGEDIEGCILVTVVVLAGSIASSSEPLERADTRTYVLIVWEGGGLVKGMVAGVQRSRTIRAHRPRANRRTHAGGVEDRAGAVGVFSRGDHYVWVRPRLRGITARGDGAVRGAARCLT